MKVVSVAASDADLVADKIIPFLVKMSDDGRFTPEHLLSEIRQGNHQCWLVAQDNTIRAVALTGIHQSEKKVCEIHHLAGEGINEWAEAVQEIEAWAKSIGCDEIESIARPGFKRLAEKRGFKATHILFRKKLNG